MYIIVYLPTTVFVQNVEFDFICPWFLIQNYNITLQAFANMADLFWFYFLNVLLAYKNRFRFNVLNLCCRAILWWHVVLGCQDFSSFVSPASWLCRVLINYSDCVGFWARNKMNTAARKPRHCNIRNIALFQILYWYIYINNIY